MRSNSTLSHVSEVGGNTNPDFRRWCGGAPIKGATPTHQSPTSIFIFLVPKCQIQDRYHLHNIESMASTLLYKVAHSQWYI